MQNYNEKRGYPRMNIECPASFDIVGEGAGGAVVKNLSGGGVLIWLDRVVDAGAELTIEIKPINDITPPMLAEMRVVRCSPVVEAAGSFAVACAINRVLG
jgi:hypothetical protein